MANPKTNPTGRITKTRLRRIYAEEEPKTQLDLFVDREGVATCALERLRDADRQAEEAHIKLPLIRKRK
jgi:hypothetical protein